MIGALASIGFAIPAVGCGDTKDDSLCTAFNELLAARTDIQQTDLSTQTASDALKTAEDYLNRVHRLQQAADNRYTQELEGLETAVSDIVDTLASVPKDADEATWRPLVQDDLDTADDATTQVADAIGPSCDVADTAVTNTGS